MDFSRNNKNFSYKQSIDSNNNSNFDSRKAVVTEKEQNKNTSDTRYYDELFTRIRDDEEFQDAESLGKWF